jgi:hypothetical protein
MDVNQLTRSTLSDLFCGDGENRKNFYHDLHNHISHRGSWLHFRVCLETLEETLDAHKDINEHILACNHIFGHLRNVSVMIAAIEGSSTILTKRRTPIPEKTTFAGENT